MQRLALPGGSDFSDDYQNDPGIIIPCKREDYIDRVGMSGDFCVAVFSSASYTWMGFLPFRPASYTKSPIQNRKSDPKRINAAFDLQKPDASTVTGSVDVLNYEFRETWYQDSSSRGNITPPPGGMTYV